MKVWTLTNEEAKLLRRIVVDLLADPDTYLGARWREDARESEKWTLTHIATGLKLGTKEKEGEA